MVNWLPIAVWLIAQVPSVMDVAVVVLARPAMGMRKVVENLMVMVDNVLVKVWRWSVFVLMNVVRVVDVSVKVVDVSSMHLYS